MDEDRALEALRILDQHNGNKTAAAAEFGLSRSGFRHLLNRAQRLANKPAPFSIPVLPSSDPTAEELLDLREREFTRISNAVEARKLVVINVNLDGPIGILHMGDPHIDDPGCDIRALRRDVELVQSTEGLFVGNVGDTQNNWAGRLERLYAEQQITKTQAWILVEWLVTSLRWLYFVKGNHDCWSGAGDPLNWICRGHSATLEAHGVRIALKFPNGKVVRVNVRHDFPGHSFWNTNHGPMKAAHMGQRDHILICGHKHTTGFGSPVKDPLSGLISWPCRAAGYKKHDRYAEELGLSDQACSPSIVTVIDPRYDDDDPRLITPFLSSEAGARYLTDIRRRG